ncbi:MAG: hypothetical protein GF418_10710 [Chitinivibrionales bacterium]|nr:hypothetical protein [Chitinivibrionales bacterium]MBD3396085.1 hypothetical protein [Chitinivibrionales bacterium]
MSLSLGGPFTGQLMYMPIPQLGIGYNRGILDSTLDIGAGWYVTSAFYGIAHVDAGLNWRPWLTNAPWPGLMVSPGVFLLTDFSPESFRAYPDLALTLFWELAPCRYLYTGIESWFELYTERSDGNPQNHHWLPAPYFGIDMGNGKWQFQVEGRLYTPHLKNSYRAVDNVGIGDYGAWGIFLGVSRSFGADQERPE